MATTTLPMPELETDERTRWQPHYAVILHDDDFNSMDWVLVVLAKVFGYAVEKCFRLMMEAHETGRSIVWTGTLEVAELKAEQIHDCGGDPGNPKAAPLGATIEELD